MEKIFVDQIPGWGADLDPEDRPAYPKERIPNRLENVPPLFPQLKTTEILHSTERPGITPVFSTALPPRGLSGVMRRMAFKYSENDIRHWLILLGADRVDMVEGIVDDLRNGYVPNPFAEMGIRAEWKYNKKGLLLKAGAAALVSAAVVSFLLNRKRTNI